MGCRRRNGEEIVIVYWAGLMCFSPLCMLAAQNLDMTEWPHGTAREYFFYHSDKTVLLYVIGTGSNGSLEFKTGNKPQQEANCRII